MPEDNLKVLFADDEEDLRELVPDHVERELKKRGVGAEVKACATVEEALQLLQRDAFHLAIVDLRFETGPTGNALLEKILEMQILPVIVYSGYPEDLDAPYLDHGLIEVVEPKKLEPLVEQIAEWREDSIFEFFSPEGLVGSRLHEAMLGAMWDNVSQYWDALPSKDPDKLADIATRIASTILLDELRTGPDGSGDRPIHPSEVYVLSSPRDYLAVGDLLERDDDRWMTLTPTCDLIPRDGEAKVERVLCARFRTMSRFIDDREDFRAQVRKANAQDPSGKARTRIEKAMRHAWANDAGERFFLPPFGDFQGGVVEFRDLETFPYDGDHIAERVDERELSLNPALSSEMATRFSRFMMRLGQPVYERSYLFDEFERFGTPNSDD